MANDKIVLAYSGGLDTSVAVPWLIEEYGADIITLTIDLGMVDLEAIRQRALQVGAAKALTVDGKETLVNEFLFPALQAGAIYEEQYPLATALGPPPYRSLPGRGGAGRGGLRRSPRLHRQGQRPGPH